MRFQLVDSILRSWVLLIRQETERYLELLECYFAFCLAASIEYSIYWLIYGGSSDENSRFAFSKYDVDFRGSEVLV